MKTIARGGGHRTAHRIRSVLGWLAILLVLPLLCACGGAVSTPGGLPKGPSETQEAMVEQQAFPRQNPAGETPFNLLPSLGNPTAPPLP